MDTKQPEFLNSNTGITDVDVAASELLRLYAENHALQARLAAYEAGTASACARSAISAADKLATDNDKLHDEITTLRTQLEAVGARGMKPLGKSCLHQISEPARAVQPIDVEAVSARIAAKVAKNCGSVPQLTFPDIYLELKELFSAPQPAAQPLDAEVQRNSARYLRIRNGPHSDQYGDLYAMRFEGDGDVPTTGKDLDAAVDAAIAAQQGGANG